MSFVFNVQSNKKPSGWPRLTIEEMVALAHERGGFCLSEKYINARTPLIWKCSLGHVWSASADSIKRGTWCPECPHDPITKEEFPHLFLLLNEKNVDLTHKSRGSGESLKWKCDLCSFEWPSQINIMTKTSIQGGCKNKECEKSDYRLNILKRSGSIVGHCPEIKNYWNYHENSNDLGRNDIPENYTKGCELSKKFKCPLSSCNHTWPEPISTFYARYINSARICSKCTPVFYKQETRLWTELTSLGFNISHKYKVDSYEFDLYCSDLNLIIEYDGKYWHSDTDKINIDIKKQNLLISKNYNLIRIREFGLEKIYNHEIYDNSRNGESFLNTIKLLISWILGNLTVSENHKIKLINYLNTDIFIAEEHYNKMRMSYEPINSIKNTHPELIPEWGDKNIFSTENVSRGDGEKFYWKCLSDKNHPEYLAAPKDRTRSNATGCPNCFGTKGVCETNCLSYIYPNFVEMYWNFDTNIENPNQIRPKSEKEICVICSACKKNNWRKLCNFFKYKIKKDGTKALTKSWQCQNLDCGFKNPYY